MSQYWLAEWTRQGDEEQERSLYVVVFGVLTGALIFVSIIRAVSFFVRALTASRKLHDKVFPRLFAAYSVVYDCNSIIESTFLQMLSAILSAPLVVFHRNPVGRLLNRFSKDLGVVDDLLPLIFFDSVQSGYICRFIQWLLRSRWRWENHLTASQVFVVIQNAGCWHKRDSSRCSASHGCSFGALSNRLLLSSAVFHERVPRSEAARVYVEKPCLCDVLSFSQGIGNYTRLQRGERAIFS